MEQWIAVRSKPRAEKVAFEELSKKGIETFLPLIKVKRKWSDRMKWVEVPLFSSYLFARIEYKNSIFVLESRGVSTIVRFNGQIISIRDEVIDLIRLVLEGGYEIETTDYFQIGDAVEVIAGPMQGSVGIISRIGGVNKFVIKIDALQQAIALHIDRKLLKLSKKRAHPIL